MCSRGFKDHNPTHAATDFREALSGENGHVIAQEGPGDCREEAGQYRVHLAPNEKLVGFKFYTDHCTCVRIPPAIAGMRTTSRACDSVCA